MKRLLLDTNVAADAVYGRRGIPDRISEARRQGISIGLPMPVAAELIAGAEISSTRDRNLDQVNRSLRVFKLWPFDLKAAEIYGEIRAQLRRKGRPIGVMDMLIAAIVLSVPNCILVTRDSDFQAVDGISIEAW